MFFGLAMVGAAGPPLGGRLKPRTARPPKGGGPKKKEKELDKGSSSFCCCLGEVAV